MCTVTEDNNRVIKAWLDQQEHQPHHSILPSYSTTEMDNRTADKKVIGDIPILVWGLAKRRPRPHNNIYLSYKLIVGNILDIRETFICVKIFGYNAKFQWKFNNFQNEFWYSGIPSFTRYSESDSNLTVWLEISTLIQNFNFLFKFLSWRKKYFSSYDFIRVSFPTKMMILKFQTSERRIFFYCGNWCKK